MAVGDRLAGPDPAGAAAEPPAAAATRYPTRTPHVRYTADPSSTREAAFAALTGGGSGGSGSSGGSSDAWDAGGRAAAISALLHDAHSRT